MNILLVEDDEILARTFCRYLRRRGHTIHHVTTIADAEHAMSLHGDAPGFDVVVTDRQVTDGDAWSWAMLYHDKTRIVFMTGSPPADPPTFYHKGQEPITRLLALIDGK